MMDPGIAVPEREDAASSAWSAAVPEPSVFGARLLRRWALRPIRPHQAWWLGGFVDHYAS